MLSKPRSASDKRNRRNWAAGWAAVCLFGLWTPAAPGRDFVMIVHDERNISSLSRDEVQRIYLGRRSRWYDGSRIEPVTVRDEPLHHSFLNAIVRRSAEQFRLYWKRALFTGTGYPPREFSSEEEVIQFVAAHPNAIGYVRATAAHPDVRVIEITD